MVDSLKIWQRTNIWKKSDKENFLISTLRVALLDKCYWDYEITED